MSLKESLLDILFPPRCAFCRRLLRRGESGMCGRCAASLPYTPEGYNDGTDFVEACVAPLFYEGAVRDALETEVLTQKQDEAYTAAVDAWVAEADAKIYKDRLN